MRSRYDCLVRVAIEARKNSYSPYSKFRVGAAVLTKKGKIYTGTNVENASYGLTVCAERVALCKSVAEGERSFVAVAVVYAAKERATPCGACLQFIAEFGTGIDIVMADTRGGYSVQKLADLLPSRFCGKGIRRK